MGKSKKKDRKFITIPMRKRKFNKPICVICLERVRKRKMKRGFEAKLKYKRQEICVHHYLILTGQRTYLPPSANRKVGVVVKSPVKAGAMLALLTQVRKVASV